MHATLVQHPVESGAPPAIVRRQDAIDGAEEMELRVRKVCVARGALLAQSVLDGQRQLDTRGTGTHDTNPESRGTGSSPGLEPLPPSDECTDRLDGNGVVGRAWDAERRRDPDVDRQHVVGDRGTVAAQDPTSSEIEPGDAVVKQSCTREPGQRPEVDMCIVETVVPGDQAGQHAGIGRVDVAGDNRDPNAQHRAHAEAA